MSYLPYPWAADPADPEGLHVASAPEPAQKEAEARGAGPPRSIETPRTPSARVAGAVRMPPREVLSNASIGPTAQLLERLIACWRVSTTAGVRAAAAGTPAPRPRRRSRSAA